jgi:hypothetical protein
MIPLAHSNNAIGNRYIFHPSYVKGVCQRRSISREKIHTLGEKAKARGNWRSIVVRSRHQELGITLTRNSLLGNQITYLYHPGMVSAQVENF